MDRWRGKVAVVTGASSGIGAAISEELVEAGLKVAGFARNKKKLEDLQKYLDGKQGKFYPVVSDIMKEDDILKAFKWVKSDLGPIYVLVNNAGIMRATGLSDGDTKLWKQVLDTNVMGLCIASREAIKDMKANKVEGHIIHINSVVGHKVVAFRNCNIYPASKFAVTALTETLIQELNWDKSKIKVTSISPGMVDTEFFPSALLANGLEEVPESVLKRLKDVPSLKSNDVADAVIYVLSTPPHVQIQELMLQAVGAKYR